jgi:hypothetical protein
VWQGLFSLTNIVAAAAWLVLLLAPRTPGVRRGVLYAGVGLLCLAYAAMFVILIGGLADPGRVPGSAEFRMDDYTIAGLRKLFLSDGGLVLGWTHYLAFDLFAGWWIAQRADAAGIGRLAQAPVLVLTFLAGPLGLLLWLIIRERRASA